jgi:hypothetical protein
MGHRGKVNSKAAAKRRKNDCVLLFDFFDDANMRGFYE